MPKSKHMPMLLPLVLMMMVFDIAKAVAQHGNHFTWTKYVHVLYPYLKRMKMQMITIIDHVYAQIQAHAHAFATGSDDDDDAHAHAHI